MSGVDSKKIYRCTACEGEFTREEVQGVNACPKCFTPSLPMLIADDLTIKINFQELRILGIWAENWTRTETFLTAPTATASIKTFQAVISRLERQLHRDYGRITFSGEIEVLQKHYPKAQLVQQDGKIIVPPKDEN